MDEEVASLDFVLRSICPIERLVIASISIEHAQKLFEVAKKLDVECTIQLLRTSLTQLLVAEPNPLRSPAIGVRYGPKEGQRAAARRFSSDKMGHPSRVGSALQYFHLLEECKGRRRPG